MNKLPISSDELDLLLETHRKYLLWESEGKLLDLKNRIIEGYDFSGKDCEGAQFLSCIFNYEFEWDEGYDNQSWESYYIKPNWTRFFAYTNFTNVNFTGSVFNGVFDFDNARLNNAIFINVDWNKLRLSLSQSALIITTVSQLTSKIKLQEDVIENKDQKIEVKNIQLDKTSERESKWMLDIFDELKFNFLREELLWMIFAGCIFFTIFTISETIVAFLNPGLASIILFWVMGWIIFVLIILSWIDKTNIKTNKFDWSFSNVFKSLWKTTLLLIIYFTVVLWVNASIDKWNTIICKVSENKECISIERAELVMIPITFILLSLLWFSAHQYWRAKKLRIEQQNKQAMIHFMQAVIAFDGRVSSENQTFPMLAPFFANAIIHRPFSQENYEPQLPIDKLFELAKNTKDLVK